MSVIRIEVVPKLMHELQCRQEYTNNVLSRCGKRIQKLKFHPSYQQTHHIHVPDDTVPHASITTAQASAQSETVS